jgi:hypothetical protein
VEEGPVAVRSQPSPLSRALLPSTGGVLNLVCCKGDVGADCGNMPKGHSEAELMRGLRRVYGFSTSALGLWLCPATKTLCFHCGSPEACTSRSFSSVTQRDNRWCRKFNCCRSSPIPPLSIRSFSRLGSTSYHAELNGEPKSFNQRPQISQYNKL